MISVFHCAKKSVVEGRLESQPERNNPGKAISEEIVRITTDLMVFVLTLVFYKCNLLKTRTMAISLKKKQGPNTK